jgi:hypothetical protein
MKQGAVRLPVLLLSFTTLNRCGSDLNYSINNEIIFNAKTIISIISKIFSIIIMNFLPSKDVSRENS